MLWAGSSAAPTAAPVHSFTDSSELESRVMASCARSLPPGSERRRYLGVGFGSEPVRERRQSPTGVEHALGHKGGGGWQLEKPG